MCTLLCASLILSPSHSAAEDTDALTRADEERQAAEIRELEARLSAGRLLRKGLTIGVALLSMSRFEFDPPGPTNLDGVESRSDVDSLELEVTQTGLRFNDTTMTRRRGFATSVAPYVGWMPFRRFIRGDINKSYCAARWSSRDARAAANELALERAKAMAKQMRADFDRLDDQQRLDCLRSAFKDNTPRSLETCTGKVSFAKCQKRTLARLACQPKRLDALARDPSGPEHEAAVAALTSGWSTEKQGSCGWGWAPGVYVGLPTGFEANAIDSIRGLSTAEFDPLFSTGLILTPNSAFSLLIGYTASNVHTSGTITSGEPIDPGDVAADLEYTRSVRTHHLSIGLGVTFDLLGFALRR